jgi:uncharacterized membrane protein YebE (DUF533 family)
MEDPTMFDAKSILDALVRGGARPQGQQDDLRGLSDLLKQLGGADANAPPPRQMPESRTSGRTDDMPGERLPPRRAEMPREEDGPGRPGAPGQGGGLDDLLRDILGGQGGSLSDILGKLQKQGGGGLGDILGRMQQQSGGSGGGGLGDILGQILGQATSGARQGAQHVADTTGASRAARDQIGQLTGRSPEELLAKLKELIANNQLAAGAALGGLGALVLGTGTGRSLAGSAIKLGGLALIGGLAYKAYQDYQRGQPVPAGAQPPSQALLAAPDGSGFEPAAVTNDHATVLIRAMIAAAAADGRIDAQEQKKILGGLQQAGLASAAQAFLTRELNHPASVDDLAAAVSSQEEAVQVYTAARVAVDPDADEEHEFLAALAERLGIDDRLAEHIDATARGAGT